MKEAIAILHEEMRTLTLDAGVGVKRYQKLGANLDRKKPKTLERIYELLIDVHENEYKEVERIWTLPTMSEDVWFNYLNIFSDTEFEEVTLLKQARKLLKGRYVAFFKTQTKKPRSANTKSAN